MFGMVLERVIITDLQKITGDIERKVTVFGYANLLTNCPALLEAPYISYYPQFLTAVVELLETPQNNQAVNEDQVFPEIDDNVGYQSAYSQLLFAKNAKTDPFTGEWLLKLNKGQEQYIVYLWRKRSNCR